MEANDKALRDAKWIVIKTQSGVLGEASNPAVVQVEAFTELRDAERAFRKKYVETVSMLAEELQYTEFTYNCACREYEARVLGEMAVVVVALKEVPVPRCQ